MLYFKVMKYEYILKNSAGKCLLKFVTVRKLHFLQKNVDIEASLLWD